MNIILPLLLSGLAPFLAAADVFCDNLKVVATTLPNNTSSSPVHMGTATVGKAPDTVYALALCRDPVLNDSDCTDCIVETFETILNSTPPTQEQCFKEAYYDGGCTIIYSDHILGPSDTTGGKDDVIFQSWNVKNVTAGVDLITGHIRDLLVGTAEKAASMTPMRFATGVTYTGTNFPLVYSLAQCTPDLSPGDCLSCLHLLLDQLNFSISLHIGGRMGVTRCYFRYEAYKFYYGEPTLLPSSPPPAPTPKKAPKHRGHISKLLAIPIVLAPLAAAAFLCFNFFYRRLTRQRRGIVMRLQETRCVQNLEGDEQLVWQGKNSELLVFRFEQLLDATNNFSEENKLGQGGFGAVYKGKLPEGLGIAVKRLASHSGQGFIEFKNEVQFIAKLQHRNLVKLLGCCSEEPEKILVYEYLPNKSLDFFIFEEKRRALLDWSKLLTIIEGIAHGLLYLHKHSRLRVIHRDLKPSNILLDNEMNPKISDFGLAKIFSSTNPDGNTTRRVVGTYGYMAPEYASKGVFSIKSDIFSFGVVILEILSGKRNSRRQQCGDYINLLGYAWKLWDEGRWIDLVDASLVPKSQSQKMMRCINIALLCTQENASDRPTMSDIVAMLSSESMIIAKPKQPAYFNVRVGAEEPSAALESCSINSMTISITMPR
ncbi:hypothetical protein CFC21_095415 [Triticum aestivum]|uniref:non-specific serine/threonine protein kinase n=2 Tax=Triticum aestivum TaxID=4565 RepID=A0A3B6RBA3_WHEAT|nr:hypothetical protein CFC21_095415 [Triticum aestivum]